MRFGVTVAAAILLGAAGCPAGTLNDIFGQPQNNCILTYTPPYDTCDVDGNEKLYDIQKATVSVSNGMATVSIYTNTGAIPYGASSLTLTPFVDEGVTLMPGDIFFYNPTAGYNPDVPITSDSLLYGIPLLDHGAFTAGDLYNIAGGVFLETAQVALQDGTDFYRWDEDVLMTGSGTPESSGTVTVSKYGDGVTQAEYEITASVPVTTGLLSLISNGQIGLLFSSADCGNDVIQGVVDTGFSSDAHVLSAPEPGPGSLTLTGLVLLTAGRIWRKRRS